MWILVAVISVYIVVVCLRRLTSAGEVRINCPGPTGLPIIGSAFSLDKLHPYETFSRWSRTFGDVYQVRIFGQRVIVLGSFKTIMEAFSVRGPDFSGRPRQFYRAAFMSDGCHDIVSASPSDTWRHLRKTVQREIKKFDPGHLRLEELMGDILDEAMMELSSHQGAAFDPREIISSTILNINCLFLIGEKFSKDDEMLRLIQHLVQLITEVMNVGGPGSELDIFPWLRFFGNKTFKKLEEAKVIRDIVYKWMREHVEEDLESGRTQKGVVHGLFSLLNSNKQQGGVSAMNIKLAIVNLLVGGSSATTCYLYLLVNVLCQYPQVQARLRQEVDKVVGPLRRPCLADRDQMNYTRATLIELLRFGSLSPILIPHSTVRSTSVGGVSIPPGTTVFFNVRAVHHDPNYWTNPYNFNPERFLDSKGSLLPPEDEKRKRVLSFGGGPRGCPGEALALSRMFLTTATLIQRFEIERDPTRPPTSCDPRTYDLGLVLNPKSYLITVVRRP